MFLLGMNWKNHRHLAPFIGENYFNNDGASD